MSETRRQLLKTSVLSALGLSAVAVAACREEQPKGEDRGHSHSPFDDRQFTITLAQSKDGKSWYVFKSKPDKSQITVYNYPGTISDYTLTNPNDQVFDTYNWFISLGNPKKYLLANANNVPVTTNSVIFQITTDASGVLDDDSKGKFNNVTASGSSYFKQSMAMWNEIGRQ